MNNVKNKSRRIRVFVVSIAVGIAFGSVGASLKRLSAQEQKTSGRVYSSKRMADGKEWTTHNLDVKIVPSYCYGDTDLNCRRYGRLYTWESAPRACQSLGDGWRLPTDTAARDFMRYSAAAALRTASMRDWKPTDSIGRHRRLIRRTDGTTTSVKAGWLSTVKTVVRSRELFQFGA
jgi:uncharacterized protein (TIGR02145 family)